MKSMKLLLFAVSPFLFIGPTSAAQFTVEITNLTGGVYFTPLLVAAHGEGTDVFEVGEAAGTELQTMAEGGDITPLSTMLDGASVKEENPAGGLLLPGASATTSMLNTDGTDYDRLSIVAMLLPTNDGFVGLDSWEIPSEAGTYVIRVNGYDAGTEANDEIQGSGMPGMAGFPVPPPVAPTVGMNGTGVGATAEGFVHIHRGVLGDTDDSGGVSDIDSRAHRWLNPVARIIVTVQ